MKTIATMCKFIHHTYHNLENLGSAEALDFIHIQQPHVYRGWKGQLFLGGTPLNDQYVRFWMLVPEKYNGPIEPLAICALHN